MADNIFTLAMKAIFVFIIFVIVLIFVLPFINLAEFFTFFWWIGLFILLGIGAVIALWMNAYLSRP